MLCPRGIQIVFLSQEQKRNTNSWCCWSGAAVSNWRLEKLSHTDKHHQARRCLVCMRCKVNEETTTHMHRTITTDCHFFVSVCVHFPLINMRNERKWQCLCPSKTFHWRYARLRLKNINYFILARVIVWTPNIEHWKYAYFGLFTLFIPYSKY